MTKKIILAVAALFMALAPSKDLNAQNQTNEDRLSMDNQKILVAYFSHSGNTRTAATQIRELLGGDILEIKTVHQYPEQYNAVLKEARQELDSGARPELAAAPADLGAYDAVFLGFPNWWGTMPMGVFTFLEQYDFAGKTIIPFCTHEGSRMGRSEADIRRLCPGATVLEGLPIRGNSVNNAGGDVADWLRRLGYLS